MVEEQGRSLVVIGNFDGVHRGHQAVLATVRRLADERGLSPKLLTFDPHPAVTLGRRGPAVLTKLDRKQELVERFCPGLEVVVRQFTEEFSTQSPDAFAQRVLGEELQAAVVMVGLNFRFGHDRIGGFEDLERLGAALGFEALAEPLVSDAHGAWSSTRVRGLLMAGEVEQASEILSRPHMLSGTVVPGDQRGRRLGFPTCNFSGVAELIPPFGVYAVLVDICEQGRWQALAKGVVNIGVRPTVSQGGAVPLVEAHLFDIDRDLYDQQLRVHLVAWLRDEQRFSGLDALKEQIGEDCHRARERLARETLDPSLAGVWA